MMWTPTRCCCLSRETGSILVAALSLAFGVVGILSMMNVYLNHHHNLEAELEHMCQDATTLNGGDMAQCSNFTGQAAFSVGSTLLVFYIIQVFISGLLIYGVRRSDPCLMVPYMVLRLVCILLLVTAGAIVVTALAFLGQMFTLIVMSVFFGGYIVVETYCLLVVYALHIQMKKEVGEHYLTLKGGSSTTIYGDYKTMVP